MPTRTQLMTPLGHSFYLPPIITFIHGPRPLPYFVSAATAFNSASKSNRESSGSLMTVATKLAHAPVTNCWSTLSEIRLGTAARLHPPKIVNKHTVSSRRLSTRWQILLGIFRLCFINQLLLVLVLSIDCGQFRGRG